MKKFILLATLGISIASYQNAKAQVSFNLTVGSQPSYVPMGYSYGNYYEPVYVNRVHYVPVRRYAPVRNHYVTRPLIVRNRVYRNSYSRPVARHYVNRNHYRPHAKHHALKSHGRGHGRRH